MGKFLLGKHSVFKGYLKKASRRRGSTADHLLYNNPRAIDTPTPKNDLDNDSNFKVSP